MNLSQPVIGGIEFPGPFIGDKGPLDRRFTIAMAIETDASAVDALRPGIKTVLRLSQISHIRRRDADIGPRHRHSTRRQRAVLHALMRATKAEPLIPKPGFDARPDHCVQNVLARLVIDTGEEVAAMTSRLDGIKQVLHSGIVTDAGQTEFGPFLRDVLNAGELPTGLFRGRKVSWLPCCISIFCALSVARPLSSPLASFSNVPPYGLGVFLVIPANSNAFELK